MRKCVCVWGGQAFLSYALYIVGGGAYTRLERCRAVVPPPPPPRLSTTYQAKCSRLCFLASLRLSTPAPCLPESASMVDCMPGRSQMRGAGGEVMMPKT